MLKKILHSFKKQFTDFDRILKGKSVGLLEWEVSELEHIFTLLLFGFMVGIPSAPMNITLEMLSCMGDAEKLLFEKIDLAHDPMGELFSLLDIG